MPRQKVKIKLIEDRQAQQVTLCKRRKGLFKKAKELATMCQALIGIIIFSAANMLTHYAHPSLDEVIARRYQDLQLPIDLELVQENERVKRKYVEEELIVSQMEGLKLENLPMEQLDQIEERMENTLRLVKERKETACYEAGVQHGQENIVAEQRDQQPGPSNVVAQQVVPEERSQPEVTPVANDAVLGDSSLNLNLNLNI